MKFAEFFKKTKDSFNHRKDLYQKYAKEPEVNLLYGTSSGNILSISQYYPNINTYEAEIKNKHEIFTISNTENCCSPIPSLIPPASSGEESLCLSEDQEKNNKRVLSLKEICSYLIDSNLLKIDKPVPKYINITHLLESVNYSRKSSIPVDKPRELLFWDIKDTIEQEKVIYEHLKDVFSQTTKATSEQLKLHVTQIKLCFFKGKYSALIRFGDPETAGYLYFNFSNSMKPRTREVFGNNFSVYFVIENNLKSKKNDWVAVVMRGLNLQIEKEHICTRLKDKMNLTPLWIEDLVTIKSHKYALFGVNSIEDAENVCKHFRNSNDIKHKIKANIHPRSSKIRNIDPDKYKKFLTYAYEGENYDYNYDESKDKIETENIKEQLKQKVLNYKSSGRLKSNAAVLTTSLPDIISAFIQNEKTNDELKKQDSSQKEMEVDKQETSSHQRTHSKTKDSKKNYNSFYSKSNYDKSNYKQVREKYRRFNDIGSKFKKNRSKSRNRSRSRSRTKSRLRSRSHNSKSLKSYGRHRDFSRSKSRDKKTYYKINESTRKTREKNEKFYKKSRSRSKKNAEKSRSRNSNERYRIFSKHKMIDQKLRQYNNSNSKSNSREKGGNLNSHYRKHSQSYEKKFKRNDSKEKYRKRYLMIDNQEKDRKGKEEVSLNSHGYSKNYKGNYYEIHNYDKFNNNYNNNSNNNKNFDRLSNQTNNEDSSRRMSKSQKTHILERINKGTHIGSKENKDNSEKYEESSHYRHKYSFYEDYHAYNEAREGQIEEEPYLKNEEILEKNNMMVRDGRSNSKSKS